VPSSSTPTHTPVKASAKKKAVKYIRPYTSLAATPPLAFWATFTATGEGGAQADNLATPATPLHQTLAASAGTPVKQQQQEQPKAIGVDESAEVPSSSSHSATSTVENQNYTQIPPPPQAPPAATNGSPATSAPQPGQPTTANETEGSPSPADFVFRVSRTGVATNPPLTDRPFKVYGRDFIKSGRWMWQQLITTIKDRTHFDPSQDEILLNWVIPLPNIDMLRDQGKEMKRMLENEILVIRTSREGHWPEWVYERVKERRRLWRRERERERQERERREAEERERREEGERAARAGTQDTIDAPMEVQGGILDVVTVMQEQMDRPVEAPVQEEAVMLDTMAVQQEVAVALPAPPGNGQESSKIELSRGVEREGIVVSKVRGTPVGREIAKASPPLEDEAVAPEISEGQETYGGAQARVERVPHTPNVVAVQATFTPVNKPQEQQVAVPSLTPPTCAGAVSPGVAMVTPLTNMASAQNSPSQKASMTTTPVPSVPNATSAPASPVQSQASLANGVHATKNTPPPRPLPQYRGRPIPMPPAYNRPANMPTRPSLGATPPVPGAPIKNASTPTQASISPTPTAAVPKVAIAPAQRISTSTMPQQVASKPTPPAAVTTTIPGTTFTALAVASSSKPRAGSAELPPAVAAATQTPLAKWLAKQGGPTVLPKAVQKAVKESNLNSRCKKLGRAIRKSMPAAVGGQTAPKEQEAAIRPRSGQAAAAQQAPVLSQSQQLFPSGTTAPYSGIASGSSSALSSYPSSNASTTSSITSAHPTRSVISVPACALTAPLNTAQLNSLAQAHSSLYSTATSSVSPTPSSASEAPTRAPITTIQGPLAAPTTTSTTQTHIHDSDSDLDLNLDLHLAPRSKKETRVPSWVKSKTPVAKGRLSLTGKLGGFGSPSPILTTPAAARAMRTFGGIGRATWGGEMPRLGFPEVVQKKEKVVIEVDHDPMDEGDYGDDDVDMGLDLQRGAKRPRDSMSTNLSPGIYERGKSNSFDLMGFTAEAIGQNRMVNGYAVSPASCERMLGVRYKSKSKKARRDVGSDGGDDDEGFLSWEGETKGGEGGIKGRVEDEDLDLGF